MPSFIEELQAMSEARKRQVLVISTVIIMAIVVGVWLTYFNSIVVGGTGTADAGAPAAAPTSTSTPSAAPAPAPVAAISTPAGPGLWGRIKNFFAYLFDSIGHMFTGQSQYTIQPQ